MKLINHIQIFYGDLNMEIEISEKISTAAKLITSANSILFITGAGISADSGLPTYRGLGGLYEGTVTDEGITIEEALSSEIMNSRPEIAWKYLWQIGSHCIKAKPNSAHLIITKIQELKPNTWILTQNIDGLHRAAESKNLIEIHGNAFELFCTRCGLKSEAFSLFTSSGEMPKLPPICNKCGGMVRPNVVLFGEMLPDKAIKQYYKVIESKPDLIISIGTSGMFQYITAPIYEAVRQMRHTIEINPKQSSISEMVTCYLPLTAATAMEIIWKKINDLAQC